MISNGAGRRLAPFFVCRGGGLLRLRRPPIGERPALPDERNRYSYQFEMLN